MSDQIQRYLEPHTGAADVASTVHAEPDVSEIESAFVDACGPDGVELAPATVAGTVVAVVAAPVAPAAAAVVVATVGCEASVACHNQMVYCLRAVAAAGVAHTP